jgi:AsmA family
LKKILKYTFRVLKIFIVVLVVLYVGVYIYVSANKKSIIKNITTELSKKLNGEVSIGDAEISFISNFPKIAVVLINVSIKDTMFTQHQHPFFNAEKVYARLGIWKLIKKEAALTGMEVKNGMMYLYTDSTGYTNKYLMQPKKDTATAAPANDDDNNELRKIAFTNTRFVLDDREKGKLYDFTINQLDAKIDKKDQVFSIDVKQNILVNNLVFNVEKGSFVKEKLIEGKYKIRFDASIKQLQFDSINLDIGNHPFNLTGRFDIGEIAGRIPQMNLKVHTKNIGFEFAKSLLAPAIAKGMSIVTLTSNLDVSASITGPLKGGEQLVNTWWSTKKKQPQKPVIGYRQQLIYRHLYQRDSARAA